MPDSHAVTSRDGTIISYTSTGCGPGIIVVTGNNRMAHNYAQLAASLSGEFTVHTIERRGRGASGPQGSNYSILHEVEDLRAVMEAVGATIIFGHSYGGFIALQAARAETQISKLVVYEPSISVNGSFDLSWLPDFDAAFQSGKVMKATVIFLKKAKLSVVSTWPTPALYALSALLLSGESGREMRKLMPNASAEIREVQRADSNGIEFRTISADTLLLGGENGAAAILKILPELQKIIPRASCTILPGLNHHGPDLGPVQSVATAIAGHLRA
jgi:pimeloyl-ACP methyl ester carboxylesterase